MTIMKIMIIVVVMALKGSGLLADHEEVVKLFDVKDYYFLWKLVLIEELNIECNSLD